MDIVLALVAFFVLTLAWLVLPSSPRSPKSVPAPQHIRVTEDLRRIA